MCRDHVEFTNSVVVANRCNRQSKTLLHACANDALEKIVESRMSEIQSYYDKKSRTSNVEFDNLHFKCMITISPAVGGRVRKLFDKA